MKLVIINGSPKRKPGNTSMLLDHFLAGFQAHPHNTSRVYAVRDVLDESTIRTLFSQADYVLLAFPLYTNAMPAGVKQFIEKLGLITHNSIDLNPKLLFLIQSGVPEAVHSRDIERYVHKLSQRLNCGYVGAIIRGGTESFYQVLPRIPRTWLLRRLQNKMKSIGKTFGETGTLAPKMLKRFAFPERLPRIAIVFFHIYSFLGIRYYGFDTALKKNRMFEHKDATPYL